MWPTRNRQGGCFFGQLMARCSSFLNSLSLITSFWTVTFFVNVKPLRTVTPHLAAAFEHDTVKPDQRAKTWRFADLCRGESAAP
jgi:hypothetical protein